MPFMPHAGRFAVVLMCFTAGVWVSAQTAAETPVFTAAQAAAGKTAFQAHCASCHAGDLGGRDDAPALKGDTFLATWKAKPVKELFDFVRTTMPPDGGAISVDDYLAIVAYALQENGATAGPQPLTASTSTLISAVLSRSKPQLARDQRPER
jgi:mono/diheme cytochrome c family protein